MAYIDAANYNRVKSMKGLPIGAIIPWSGEPDSIPPGWITCSGTTFEVTRYPLLYEIIGSTYGGTVGNTFATPNLNNTPKAMMDIFRGHYYWLDSSVRGAAHNPNPTGSIPISSNTFWTHVGGADNGNQSSSIQQDHPSTIDVVGVMGTMPPLVALHTGLELSTGDYQSTVSINDRKLSDVHIPRHGHSYESAAESPSYERRNSSATFNPGSWFDDGACRLEGTGAVISRSVNDPPLPGDQNFTCGGGNIGQRAPTRPQVIVTVVEPGDGCSAGDMYSNRNGQVRFATSLSNQEINFSQVIGHNHGTVTHTYTSRIRVVNPGTVNDVQIHTVTIDNTPGRDFATINMNSGTPSLSMLFIIRAY